MSTEATIFLNPSKQSKTVGNLSMILNHEHSESNNIDQISRQYSRAVSDLSALDSNEGTLSSNSSKYQIEMAISELNMDDEIIRNLKDAFNCSSSSSTTEESCGDAASALLGLKDGQKLSNPQNTLLQIPYYAYPAYQKKTIKPQTLLPSYSSSSSHSPFMHNPARPFRRVKQYTSFLVKLRHNDRFWEIIAHSPEFEEHQVKIKLIKRTSGLNSEAILIEAAKCLLIRCANGSIIEKTISARNVIPLGGPAASSPIISVLRRGYLRIHLEKQ